MLNKSHLFIFLLLFSRLFLEAASPSFDGRVIDMHTGEGIPGVEILSGLVGTITDQSGYYRWNGTLADSLKVRCMGYETLQIASEDVTSVLVLKARVLEGQSIHIAANRVIPGISPVAYSILEPREIESRYTVEDVPMILSSEVGIHAYSESGNGTGYSYVSIRGFDQSRIAVMLDNVPLNDNESHQVYWVDHGDILSSAKDIEIQRGVGSSLYGASAFGGSINIHTGIKSEHESISLGALNGSFNTEKYRLAYKSGQRFGDNLSVSLRASILNSDGYRVDSRSEQNSVSLAIEQRGHGITNQLRGIIGKEFSVLQWDGISREYLENRTLRRQKMSWTVPFTDDFLQQIYSLNTRIQLNPHSTIRNVTYLVKGSGFYEVQKYGQDFYTYNLDVNDIYPDSIELGFETDLLRRKWINNVYYGITPVWTRESKRWRSDIGLELRTYKGDHFGEVMNVSDSTLQSILPKNYEYYSYAGNKSVTTLFGHFLIRITPKLNTSLDLRAQQIKWQLDQEKIGHAQGVDLTADWQFFDPRFGLNYALSDAFNLFISRGVASMEPADAQIIEADDVWSKPTPAEAERVINTEIGVNYFSGATRFSLNLYRIEYQNELLSDIYDFQDGGFTVETADQTLHQGVEIDMRSRLSETLELSLNGTIAEHRLSNQGEKGNYIANVPGILSNGQVRYDHNDHLHAALSLKYVGKQFIDQDNTEDIAIPGYVLTDLFLQYELSKLLLEFKLNNLLNTQYATFGYNYYGAYYWPGATRNYSLSMNYSF
ncbi:MAG: TonB-dependent receptor [Candidatus Marinimicrobia bacterium]|nr:TonB-dependent receptor [Candidatus Neomarinimicrobiota bacterium]